jgi:hypothetical protein
MSKQFDELAKSLARDTSRRSALRMFLTGIGTAMAGVFFGRGTAQAAPKGHRSHGDKCRDHCEKYYGGDSDKFDKCCDHSENCSDDCCAVIIGVNATQEVSVCVAVEGD